ncbi:MAG TPA: sn-glycerol-3-phosphate ABC transporter ATP-binding protein UgpC [Roseiarcus sp.]|nr:sn-glycerol-3-phosphate ABC transporter ATP-binding protein UgpC [Roseiarcus sp.]
MATVSLSNITKSFGNIEIVHGIDLEIRSGEFVVLLGPSGCGKTTTLRMVAGLENISGGMLKIGGRVVNEIAPKDRKIAMVFQNYALYPHMTVRQNMAFALKPQKMTVAAIDAKVREVAEIVGLEELLERKPAQLSGGQRQRVAMGRALVRTPEVFLFDEPLSNLDAKLRTQMRLEIQKLHRRLKTTSIYVTHDQIEAMTLADRIVIMRDGRIEQIGAPREVFSHPKNVFVATFIGSPSMNLLPMRVTRANEGCALASGTIVLPLPLKNDHQVREGQEVLLGVRPNFIRLASKPALTGNPYEFEARAEVVELLGADGLVALRLGEHELIAQVDESVLPEPDAKIWVGFDAARLHVFDRASGDKIL